MDLVSTYTAGSSNFCSHSNLGKSAVATAIQVCLGATARTTGRGANLSTFIREGSDRPAVVRITLWNEGADAFEPEKYGKQITVERTINRSGLAGGYVIYDTNGKVSSIDNFDIYSIYILHRKYRVSEVIWRICYEVSISM